MSDKLLDNVMTFETVTRDIRVAVQSYFLDERSSPETDRFIWAYRIRIVNEGADIVTLLNRHWIITNGKGEVEEVRGAGVVGEHPRLEPGESFTYTSGTPLTTPSGFMVGTYEFVNEAGEQFHVDIPAFSLDSPHAELRIN
ncbi:protein ApaG [Kordiimonas sediminis]|uniref:Protein ApaG n=1 Tax=Kordiimonas sediminis TaxID=1735581 RepID=A0A919E5E9_9PROT|nr:Co2+/Mg2+ efflux protein ApaG [Kordiimonas sediminis]GHF15709.1 protein ApaG [Kordiimonas sediminis]